MEAGQEDGAEDAQGQSLTEAELQASVVCEIRATRLTDEVTRSLRKVTEKWKMYIWPMIKIQSNFNTKS